MRRVVKRVEPRALTEYRNRRDDPNRSYEHLPSSAKHTLQAALLQEQGGICCYCMARIELATMKIEHFRPQSAYPNEALVWRNMLGSCEGGKGRPEHQQTCDTKKRDRDLRIDPRDPGSIARLRYLPDGTIVSDDEEYAEDIDRLLNLNLERLVTARKGALGGIIDGLERRRQKGPWTPEVLERMLAGLRATKPFTPFLGAIEYWLEKKLRTARGKAR